MTRCVTEVERVDGDDAVSIRLKPVCEASDVNGHPMASYVVTEIVALHSYVPQRAMISALPGRSACSVPSLSVARTV